MLVLSFLFTFLGIVSLELELDSYEKDVGAPPSWMTVEQQKAAITDRWYVDKATATCKPFKYLGSLGNFNNFVSQTVCMHHLTFTAEEQANSCKLLKSEGKCTTVPEESRKERWYFSAAAVGSGAVDSCYKFKYSGCGGNANNFETEEECKNACKNNVNGGMSAGTGIITFPNKFDCRFTPDVNSASPKMGIVFHTDKKRCVYAAIASDATRGFFPNLPMCVMMCVEDTVMVPACKAKESYQIPSTAEVTTFNEAKEYFYFDVKTNVCRRFRSKEPPADKSIKIDDGTHNIFSSAEICASYCPALGNIGKIKAVDVCKQEKVGEWKTGDKYKIQRFHFTPKVGQTAAKCTEFSFNGKVMNLNNFASAEVCQAICETPTADA